MTSNALVDVEDVRAGVDAALARHVADLAAEVGATGVDDGLADALRAILGGGKRLRAAFCYWSWRAHGGDATDVRGNQRVLGVGAALELFQAAALFHDDVMDASRTRRGQPAAHRRFAELHLREGWSGPADRFGESVAILLGDLALVAAERAFASAVADAEPGHRAAATAVFDRMRTEVLAGQYLDVLVQAQPWGHDPEADEARARAVARAKSARYSVEHPLVLGAVLAGAHDDAVGRLRAAGLPLGEAFQLRDDVLGVFGDPAATGKPAGDDLREGKRTVLAARALRHATPADREVLLDGLGRRDLDDAGVERLRSVVRRTGAADAVEELIERLARPALASLEAAPLAEPGRSMLVRLGRAAVERAA